MDEAYASPIATVTLHSPLLPTLHLILIVWHPSESSFHIQRIPITINRFTLRRRGRQTTARDISNFQADFSQSKVYSAALVATSTPRNLYEHDSVTKPKQSGNVRRVSMNTPPSASPKSISATEVLAQSPRFSSLGSGFNFPTEPLGLSYWDSSDASLAFSPRLPLDKSSRSDGDEPSPNTANLTPSPHVVDVVVVKGGKGRARNRSIPVGSAKWNAREKRLFDPGRIGGNIPEETQYASLSIEISNAHQCLPIIVGDCPCH